MKHILVIDDEPDIRSLLQEILEDEGFSVAAAKDADHANQERRKHRPDLILLDIWMPGIDGVELLNEWNENDELDCPVIMMSGHGTVETAVETLKIGAYDFIEKPLSISKILVTIERALETASLQRENLGFKKQHDVPIEKAFGQHAMLSELRSQIERVAAHDTSALITGATGSGKETFARFLHQSSPHADGPFITVNIAGLSRETPENELFGSEHSGEIHFGYLEQANGGTLFLKDIFDMDINLQARLLSTLENQSLFRVGGREAVTIDVRIIAATRHDLLQSVSEGQFREELYYFLNVIPLHIPSLSEHAQDIPDLLDYYLQVFINQEGLPPRSFSRSAKERLRQYEWPGNIRELTNLVQRLLILGGNKEISLDEVEKTLGLQPLQSSTKAIPAYDLSLREARDQFERSYLEYQLQSYGGNVTKVAAHAQVERTNLYRKLRTLDIDPKKTPKGEE